MATLPFGFYNHLPSGLATLELAGQIFIYRPAGPLYLLYWYRTDYWAPLICPLWLYGSLDIHMPLLWLTCYSCYKQHSKLTSRNYHVTSRNKIQQEGGESQPCRRTGGQSQAGQAWGHEAERSIYRGEHWAGRGKGKTQRGEATRKICTMQGTSRSLKRSEAGWRAAEHTRGRQREGTPS